MFSSQLSARTAPGQTNNKLRFWREREREEQRKREREKERERERERERESKYILL